MATEKNIPNEISIPGSLIGRHESSNIAPMGFSSFSTNMKSDISPMGFSAFTTRMKSYVFPIPFANFTTRMKSDIAPMSTLSFSTNMKSDIAPMSTLSFSTNMKSDVAPISLPGEGRHESSTTAPINSTLGANNESSTTAPINSTLIGRHESSTTAPINSILGSNNESSTTAPINSILGSNNESSDTSPINSTLDGRHESSGIDDGLTTPSGRHESSGIDDSLTTLDGRHESSGIDDSLTTLDGRHESSIIDDSPTTPDGRFTNSTIDDSPTTPDGRNESSTFDPEPGVNFLDIPNVNAQGFTPNNPLLESKFVGIGGGPGAMTYGYPDSAGKKLGAVDNQILNGVNFLDIDNLDAIGFTPSQLYLHSQFQGVSGQGPKPTYDYPDNHGLGYGLIGNSLFSAENTPYTTPIRPDGFQTDRGDELEVSLFSKNSFDGGGILGTSTEFTHPTFGGVQGQVPVMGNNPTGLGQFLEGGNTSGDIGIVDAFDDTTSGAKGFTPQMFDLGLPKTQFNGVAGTPGSLEYAYPTDVGPAGVGRLMYDVPFSDAGNPYGGEYASELAKQLPINPLITINKDVGAEATDYNLYDGAPDRLHFHEGNKYQESIGSFTTSNVINGFHPSSILADFALREGSPAPLDNMKVLIPANTGPTGESQDTAEYTHVEGYPNYQTHNLSYQSADVANQRVGFDRTELNDRGVYSSGKYGNFMGPQRGDGGFYFTSDLYGHDLAFGGHGDDPKKLKQYRLPHILRDMERKWNGTTTESTPFDEGAFRGGFLTLGNRAVIDVVRNTKHIIDDPIKGLLWGLKQIGLQASNPKVETEMAFLGRRTRTFNLGVGLLANMLTGPFGIKLYRHGLFNGIGEEDATYEAAVRAHNTPDRFETPGNYPGKGGGNRLIGLKEGLIISQSDEGEGPGGLFGGFLSPGIKGVKIKPLSDTAFFFGPKSLYGIGGTSIRRYEHSHLHPLGKGIEASDSTNAAGGDSNLLAKYATLSYGDLQFAAEGGLGSSFNDFRLDAYANVDDGEDKFIGGALDIEDYDSANREVMFGYAPYRKDRNRNDFLEDSGLTDPWNKDFDGAEDYGSGEVDDREGQRDMIKFIVEDVYADKRVRFRSYITDLVDSINPSYAPTAYVGRPDAVHSYQNTNRTLSFTLKMASLTRQGMAGMYKKANYLMGLCYPHLGSGTPEDAVKETMIAPLIKLTIGDWMYKCPGYFTELSFTIDNTFPWEINIEQQADVAQLPQVLSIGVSFTVLGDGPHTSAVLSSGEDKIAGRHIGGGVNDITAKDTFLDKLWVSSNE